MKVYMLMTMILLFVGVVLKPEHSNRRKKYYILFSFVLLFVISAFRDYSVGIDTKTYVNLYSIVDKVNIINGRWEPGFIALLKMLRNFSRNPASLLFVSSGICVGCTCLYVKKFSKDATMAIVLYVLLRSYFFQMNVMRQMLAVALCLLAFTFLIQGRKIFASSFILLAASMHTVAILAFLPYTMWIFRNTGFMAKITPRKAIKWIIFILLGVYVAYPMIVNMVGWAFPKYVGYFTSQWSDTNYFAALINTMMEVVFLIGGAHYFGNKKLDDIEWFALIMLICSITFYALSMRMEIWSKVAIMFRIYTSLLWTPAFIYNIQNGKRRFFMKGLIIGFSWLYLMVVFLYRPEWDGVIPYAFR